MSKEEAHHRRLIAQTLDYQAQRLRAGCAGIAEVIALLTHGLDNEACSRLLQISYDLGNEKEMLDRMLAEVRSGRPTQRLTSAPPTKRL